MKKNINYDDLNAFIQQENHWFTAAELHGILSAWFALKRPLTEALPLLFGAQQQNIPPLCEQMWRHIESELKAEHLQYTLILPEDSLRHRAEALIFWLQGFEQACRYAQYRFDAQQQELMQTLRSLQDLDCNIEDNEENQRLFNILEEHARLCVFSLMS